MDYGINECDFWNMTIGELHRAIESRQRQYKLNSKEKATYDYILADLIGRSVSRVYNSSNKLPQIAEVYPTLFDAQEMEEKKREKQAELSALRFKQFADTFNKRFKEANKSSG